MTMPARISFEHQAVHEAKTFHFNVEATVAASTAHNVALLCPANNEVHLVVSVLANNPGKFRIYESPSLDAPGAPVLVYNMKRNASRTPETIVRSGETLTDVGLLLDVALIGSGTTGATRVGGQVRAGTEWVLSPGGVYLLQWTSGAAEADIVLTGEFYEVRPH